MEQTEETKILIGGSDFEKPISPYKITWNVSNLVRVIDSRGLEEFIETAKAEIENAIKDIYHQAGKAEY